MRHHTRPIVTNSSLVLLLLGCSVSPSPGAFETADQAANAAQTLTCKTLTVTRGSIGSGQTAPNLATRQLTGTQDVWNDYVEFSPNASATCTYALPVGTLASDVTSLALQINYRGPKKAAMRWTFEALDATTGTWVFVGDNAFAQDWIWSAATLTFAMPAARFFSNGSLKVRYQTQSSVDSSDVDQLVVLASTNSTGTGGSGGSSSSSATSGASGGSGGAGGGSGGTGGASGGSGAGGSGGASGIWRPHPGTSWQWQLTGTIDTSVNVAMYDIDLFDSPQATIDLLHSAGRKVICYFSAGTRENWRPDANQFPAGSYGNAVSGWPGENWLDVRNSAVRAVMLSRMDLAVSKHCDGLEPDNVDGYSNNSGFPLSGADQINYNTFLATSAHARTLSVGLKNDVDQVAALVSAFDWALNEECFKFDECGSEAPFISANKAVFQVEYGSASLATSVCPKANLSNFDTLIKNLDLDAWRVACR
jgi:hypothetical protein